MPIPDIKEQKRIVDQYNAIQSRIETNKQTIVKLEETAQAIYRKMFIDNIDLEDLPDGWEKGSLSEIATINMGQSPAGNTLNKQGNGILFYQGCTDFGIRFVAPRVYTTAPTKFAEPYDILISVRAPVGSLNITKEQCCIGRGLAAIKATCESQSFVFYTLKNQTQAFSVADDEGSIFGSINKDGLKNLSIVIPPKSLIKEYDKLVSPIDKLIIHYESEINILQDTLSVIL
jgi:type I restriction enzyme S subunit